MEDLFVQTTYWLVSGLKHHLVQWKEFLDKWCECEVIAGYETFIPLTSYTKTNIVQLKSTPWMNDGKWNFVSVR
jgi:hypothetical protein